MTRVAERERVTKETNISARVDLDGEGRASIELPLPFFTHMIESFVRYSGMDVTLRGSGDIDVDAHHLVEDTGLVLGAAVSDALGERAGIRRFGDAVAPLDESLVRCAIDYGRRPHVVWAMDALRGRINEFDVSLLAEFVKGYAQNAGATVHVDCIRGDNLHHVAEAAFKAMGLATREAFAVFGSAIPSTKGTL
ncbi:MAG: imidazoleglycerol-phosphate dehydratase HisB [Candidatus Dormibacteraeota bacterium]|nr:imidazoleglycerol-phosphate dehydratase HisB [Candidatus Dormibacteraeota bacterium]